jgi:hypothetical protein
MQAMECTGNEVDMGIPAAETDKQVQLALVRKAAVDLARTCERSRLSPTDIVNRAISLYEFLDAERASGTEVLLRRRDGSTVSVQLM